jgi:hypothetical protein
MTGEHRRRRGAETQNLVAAYFKAAGFPYAESAGAGRNGRDVLGTPGLACEVKARRDFSPIAWTRQAAATADGDLPLVVMRPDGLGPAHIDEWPAILRFSDLLGLLRAAGYIAEVP